MPSPRTEHPEKFSEQDLRAHRQQAALSYARHRPRGMGMRDWLFCHEYLLDLNAKDAALRAGFPKTVAQRADSLWLPADRELSKKPLVWDRVAELMRQRFQVCEIGANDILREFSAIGFVDPIAVFREDYDLKPMNQIPEDVRRAISEVRVTTNARGDVQKSIKFHNKLEALVSLARYHNMFKDDNRKSIDVNATFELKNMPTDKLRIAFMAEIQKLPENMMKQLVDKCPDMRAYMETSEPVVVDVTPLPLDAETSDTEAMPEGEA